MPSLRGVTSPHGSAWFRSKARPVIAPSWIRSKRGGVEDKDYQPPYRFPGKIAELTIKLGPAELTSNDQAVIQHALNKAKD
jgi:hypothetical protein